MIREQDIQIQLKNEGVFLSAETIKCKYGQFYSFNKIKTIAELKEQFIRFYNRFE